MLINKAMIEIPPTFAGQPPVNPDQRGRTGQGATWKGATGLAEDVRFYGTWMRDEAERRIGHLYPKVTLPKEQGGGEATVIAWLWARTVTCPNPACGAETPLIRSFVLSKKKGKEAYLVPTVHPDRTGVGFKVRHGTTEDKGTVGRKGARCLICQNAIPLSYIRSEGKRRALGSQPLATVADGTAGRVYVDSRSEDINTPRNAHANWRPNAEIAFNPRDIKAPTYGMTSFADLFTERQLVALTTLSDLVGEARERVQAAACAAGRSGNLTRLTDGGSGAVAYADAVSTYLALGVSKLSDIGNSICTWKPSMDQAIHLFTRQAIPMTWDFAETQPFSGAAGDYALTIRNMAKVIGNLALGEPGYALQQDAVHASTLRDLNRFSHSIVSTDPPYYDNVGYAALSDFFYVWLRRSLAKIFPDLFKTLLVPKAEELVATPYRFDGGKDEAEKFFEDGLRQTFKRFAGIQDQDYPATVYYAFKQAETENRGAGQNQTASTGWETMLEGLISSGFQITGTWPMRTELANRMIGRDANALASSIVLACRVRPENATEATRQQFLREMRQKLAKDLRPLQQANIAPVDLAQAAIGPGMAIYSRYRRVREASGDPLRVRAALGLINQVLDEVLAEQDEEYDNATRWAVSWYESFGMNEGPYGDAEGFARARNVAVADLAHEGLVKSGRGKVRFTWREEYPELPAQWKPRSDDVSDWVIMQRLTHAIQSGQEAAATIKARLDAELPGRTETARDLAYRVFNIAERKGWTREALAYNTLVQNWSEIEKQAGDLAQPGAATQMRIDA